MIASIFIMALILNSLAAEGYLNRPTFPWAREASSLERSVFRKENYTQIA